MPGSKAAFRRAVAALATVPGRAPAGPDRRFWLIVGLITVGSAVLRVLTHDYNLPWYAGGDELQIWIYARATDYNPYPPLILWLHQLLQPLAEAQGRPYAPDTILDLRRLVLLFNVAATVWFALLGRRCGGPLAGIIAALLWAFEPTLLVAKIQAVGESFAYPLQILAILLAVHSLESGRRPWHALAGAALGFVCFLGDFRWLVAVFPGVVALLWHAWLRYRPGWQRALPWASAGLALAVLAGALVLGRLPGRFQLVARDTLLSHLWDFDSLFHFLGVGLGLLHPWFLVLFLALVLLTLHSTRPARPAPLSTPALLVVGATMILTTWAMTAIRPYGDLTLDKLWLRYRLPALLMLYLLLATAIAYLLPRVQAVRIRNLLSLLFAAGFLLFHFLPSLQVARDYRVTPWPVIVRNWVDDNLESSKVLVYEHSQEWFDNYRRGLPRRIRFESQQIDDIRDKTLQQWLHDDHVAWALIPVTIREQQLLDSSEGRALLDQMLLIREFSAPPFRRSYETILYRLWRMQHETDIRFGEHIRLAGYDLHTPEPQPGDDLELTLYWNAATTPAANHSLFLHLVDDDDPRPLAQLDGNPAIPARPTQTWDRPEETLISPRFSLTLPADLPPGDYRVMLGLHNFETGERLPLRDASDTLLGDAWELLRMSMSDDGTVTIRESARAAR